jgi:hypothetical protein
MVILLMGTAAMAVSSGRWGVGVGLGGTGVRVTGVGCWSVQPGLCFSTQQLYSTQHTAHSIHHAYSTHSTAHIPQERRDWAQALDKHRGGLWVRPAG